MRIDKSISLRTQKQTNDSNTTAVDDDNGLEAKVVQTLFSLARKSQDIRDLAIKLGKKIALVHLK